MRVSKNPNAEKICGLRERGTALFEPHELGYACPICGADDEENLYWSEYNYFIWCKKCNLDIPSILCVKYPRPRLSNEPLGERERVEFQIKLFLECLEHFKARILAEVKK